jgi:hypothetical protein
MTTIWEDRWKALEGVLDKMKTEYNSASFPRRKTLEALTLCLRAFAESQFRFFHDGLNTEGDIGPYNLQPSADYWRRYAATTVLNQVQHDIEAIQRIAYQRETRLGIGEALNKTDKLAQMALQPAIDKSLIGDAEFGGLAKNLTAVTYFQKFSAIVHIPYAPVALIGIPATAMAVPRDYLAIPHEAGHYVYRHGRLPDNYAGICLKASKGEHVEDALRRCARELLRQAKLPTELYDKTGTFRWLEEMFADIYGCQVAGPVIALDFQDLQLQKKREQFITLDDDHPTPLFRPDVYAKVLAAKGGAWAAMAERLYRKWHATTNVGGNEDVVGGEQEFKTKWGLEVKALISPATSLLDSYPVDAVIVLILELLNGIQNDWSGDLGSFAGNADALTNDEATALYNNSAAHLNSQVGEAPPPPELTASPSVMDVDDARAGDAATQIRKIWAEWIKSEKIFGGNPPPSRPGEIQHGKPATPAGRANAWIPILKARGWAVDGPNGQWKG